MKLATYHDGSRDGQLWVVSRDLRQAAPAVGIARTMREALEAWDDALLGLTSLYERLNAGEEPLSVPFDPACCLAPLPRAPQWLDASAFLNHGQLMDKAFETRPMRISKPFHWSTRGASDDFRGPMADIEFPDDGLRIGMEGEFGVVVSDVPMGAAAEAAPAYIRLLVQLNDWSLRALGPREMRAGFGWLQAKPSTAFAPVAIMPDEIAPHWQDCRIKLPLHVEINGREVGRANGAEMHFSFADIIAHCARTRKIAAGTILGSGTVSNADRAAGSVLHFRNPRHRAPRSRCRRNAVPHLG